jgi:hypothetical protein
MEKENLFWKACYLSVAYVYGWVHFNVPVKAIEFNSYSVFKNVSVIGRGPMN